MSVGSHEQALAMKQKLTERFYTRGILTGLFSGCTWGINNMLLGLALTLVPAMGEEYAVYAIPLAAACMNDGLAGCWLLLYNGFGGRFQEIIRSVKTKPGLIVCFAAILGGPMANGGYLLGISMAGPAYALTITALYPVVGAILARVFLKQELLPRVMAGIMLSIIGSIVISYTPPEGAVSEHFYLGLLFACLAALGWGAECVLAVFGMSMLDPKIAINIRELTSGIVFALFVLPLVAGWMVISEVVTEPKAIGVFAAAALAAGVSYLAWYKANNTIGVPKGMAMNGTYVMWGVIFSVLFLGQELTQTLALGAFCVFCGATLVAVNPMDFFRKGGDV